MKEVLLGKRTEGALPCKSCYSEFAQVVLYQNEQPQRPQVAAALTAIAANAMTNAIMLAQLRACLPACLAAWLPASQPRGRPKC